MSGAQYDKTDMLITYIMVAMILQQRWYNGNNDRRIYIWLYTFIGEEKPSNYYTNELYVRRICLLNKDEHRFIAKKLFPQVKRAYNNFANAAANHFTPLDI